MVLRCIVVSSCVALCIGLIIYLIKDIRRLLKIQKEVREIIKGCEEAVKQCEEAVKRVEKEYLERKTGKV